MSNYLTNFEILKSNAKIEADWKKEVIITYADEIEHNARIDKIAKPVEDVLKSFEIIVKKNVNVSDLKCCESVEAYNVFIGTIEFQLTEDEFALLKKTIMLSPIGAERQ